MPWLPRRLYRLAVATLTKPRRRYALRLPNDLDNLRRFVRKGDVVLIDGEQRISEVIKYLTQSSWSHVALYVGDEIGRRAPQRRTELVQRYGVDADHLIVEALVEGGVVVSPLAKYASYNLRVCRPHRLRAEDCQRILDEVVSQIGIRYDVQHILDLARYLLPLSLIPRRLRRRALTLGSGRPTEVICSSLIARAFQNVGFPILPAMTRAEVPVVRRGWLDRFRHARHPYPAVFHRQDPRVITPRDFDLSPYFEIVKFNAVEALEFDYRRIRWA